MKPRKEIIDHVLNLLKMGDVMNATIQIQLSILEILLDIRDQTAPKITSPFVEPKPVVEEKLVEKNIKKKNNKK